MIGAVAGGLYTDVPSAMAAMSAPKQIFEPGPAAVKDLHDRRFAAFERLQEVARAIRTA
jgi:D-ribulokinase